MSIFSQVFGTNRRLTQNARQKQSSAKWVTVGGRRFFSRSDWEISYACLLESLKRDGQIADWEYETTTFYFEGIRRGVTNYKPDFQVMPKGHTAEECAEFHEVKGWMDPKSQIKIKRMAKYHPDVKLIVRDAAWFKAHKFALAAVRALVKPEFK